jgi:hypothetical protein
MKRQEHYTIPESLDCLRAIVSQEPPWNEDTLADWANDFLYLYDEKAEEKRHIQHMQAIQEEVQRFLEQVYPLLKHQVQPYRHDPSLPPLPKPPHGQLHGIGFIYDEDQDDRVLIATQQLKNEPGLVALADNEGRLEIYTRQITKLTSINVGCDVWRVSEFVPYQERWQEVDHDFMQECVALVLGQQQ